MSAEPALIHSRVNTLFFCVALQPDVGTVPARASLGAPAAPAPSLCTPPSFRNPERAAPECDHERVLATPRNSDANVRRKAPPRPVASSSASR